MKGLNKPHSFLYLKKNAIEMSQSLVSIVFQTYVAELTMTINFRENVDPD